MGYAICKTDDGYALKNDWSTLRIAQGETLTGLLHNLHKKCDGRYFVELTTESRRRAKSSYRAMQRLISYDESVCDIRHTEAGLRYVTELWILLEDTGAREDVLYKVKGFHDFMMEEVKNEH